MKICKRGLNFIQIYNNKGDVRICSWLKDGHIGNLIDNTFEEVFHSEKANIIRSEFENGDYSRCDINSCPWLANNELDDYMDSYDEVPKFPKWLFLAYENNCNYDCTVCSIHENKTNECMDAKEKRYDKIGEEIRKVLPYVNTISANGMGELFASPRIIEILNEWKPISPKSECSVVLETNGSLFNEKNWEKIKSLGEYHLTVAVTVMSFDEYTYQLLSGTKNSISQLEHNLEFIRSLREQNIINDLRIATVVQERNFREMPSFARRCIEEYKADYVRLRSFVPWGKKTFEEEWFTDVINPYHPYHDEYLEIMKDPIFKNKKVHDWSGGIGTTLGEHPWKKQRDLSNSFLQVANEKISIIRRLISESDNIIDAINKKIAYDGKIVIYGLGDVGKTFAEVMCSRVNLAFFIDQNSCEREYLGKRVYQLNDIEETDSTYYAIVTPLMDGREVEDLLAQKGFCKDNIIQIRDLINGCC